MPNLSDLIKASSKGVVSNQSTTPSSEKKSLSDLVNASKRATVADSSGHEEFTRQGSLGESTSDQVIEDYDRLNVSLYETGKDTRGSRLAENQSASEQFGRAVTKGVVKGGLTFLENVGYLTDMVEMVQGVQGIDDASGNWLSEIATQSKAELDDEYAIYRTDPSATWDFSDSGWVFQQLEGLIDSGVGFGLTGAGVGSLVGKGAAALAQMTKMGLMTEQTIATLGTAMATNYAESKMMSLQLYKDVYDTAIQQGRSQQEAEGLAAEQAREFVWQNKTGILTDAIGIHSIFKGKGFGRGAGPQSFKDKAMGMLKQAPTEAYEEISAGFLQKDNLRDAEEKLGMSLADAGDNYVSRALAYAISPEGLLEGALGMIGGPVQALMGKGAKAGLEKATGKSMDFGQGSFEGTKDEVYETLVDTNVYKQELAKAVEKGDDKEAQRLTSTRFDTVAGKFFQNKKGEVLEASLQEMANDEALEPEKRKLAAEKLAQLPALEAEYDQIYKDNRNKRDNTITKIWDTKVQRDSMVDLTKEFDSQLASTTQSLINSVSDFDQKDLSVLQVEGLVLKEQAKELDSTLKELGSSNFEILFPEAKSKMDGMLADMQARHELGKEALDSQDDKVSESVMKAHGEYQKIIDLAKKRIDTLLASNIVNTRYQKLTNDKYQESVNETIAAEMDKKIPKIKDLDESEAYRIAIEDSDLSDIMQDDLLTKIEAREQNLVSRAQNNEAIAKRKELSRLVKEATLVTSRVAKPTKTATTPAIDYTEVVTNKEVPSETKTVVVEAREPDPIDYKTSGELRDMSPTDATGVEERYEPEYISTQPSIATYITNTDIFYNKSKKHEYNQKDNTIGWFMDNHKFDKVGVSLEFAIDPSDEGRDGTVDRGVLANALNRKKEDVLMTAPIRMYVLNNNGSRKQISGKDMWLYVRKSDLADAEFNVFETRKKLIKDILEGKRPTTKIASVYGGYIHNDESRNPSDVFGSDVKVYVSDGEQLVVSNYNEAPQTDGKFTTAGTPGRVYIGSEKIKNTEGKVYPLAVNAGRLSPVQSQAVMAVYQAIADGTAPNDLEFKKTGLNIDGQVIKGLTPVQILNLLVYDGPLSENSSYPLHYDKKSKMLAYKDSAGVLVKKPLATIAASAELTTELMNYLSTVPVSTNARFINKTFKESSTPINDDFTWFGQEVSADSNYNDFLFGNGHVSTDVVTFGEDNSITMVQPYVTVLEDPSSFEYIDETEIRNEELEPGQEVTPVTTEEPKAVNNAFAAMVNKAKGLEAESIAKDGEGLIEKVNIDTDSSKEATNVEDVNKEATPKVAPIDPSTLFNTVSTPIDVEYNVEEEIAKVKSILPNQPTVIHKGLLQFPGGVADGMFFDNVITLADVGKVGTGYHEAFHAVTQQYLTPEQRAELYKSTYPDVSEKQAEEFLAEDFREYMKSQTLPKGKRSLLKRLFDGLKELINYLTDNKKNKLFRDIQKGRFANRPIFKSTEMLFNEVKLSARAQGELADSMVMLMQKYTQFNEDLMGPALTREGIYDVIKAQLKGVQAFLMQAEVKNDLQIANYETALNNWDAVIQVTEDKLLAYNLRLPKDAKEAREESNEAATEEYASGALNIKSALMFSGKENATGLTKLLVSTLVDRSAPNGPEFGLPSLASFSQSWAILENELSSIVDDMPVSGKEHKTTMTKMIERLAALKESHPQFTSLYDKLVDPNYPENTKVQFIRAFSKQAVTYNTSVITDSGKGSLSFKIINADSNNKQFVLRNSWLNNHKDIMVKDGKFNVRLAENISQAADKLRKDSRSGEVTDNQAMQTLLKLYKEIGVDITAQDVLSYMRANDMVSVDDVIKRTDNSLLTPFTGVAALKAKTLAGITTWDDKANVIEDISVIKDLSRYAAENSKIPGENMVRGPENNGFWTKSENHYSVKSLQVMKTQSEVLDSMLAADWHKHSKFLQQMKSSPNKAKFNLEVFLSSRVEDTDDAGTAYADLVQADELIERVNRTMAGMISPLTFGDKSTWLQLSGFNIPGYSNSMENAVNDIYDTYFIAEYERTLSPDPSSDIENFKKDSFYLFPSLNNNDKLYKDSTKQEINVVYVKDTIRTALEKQIVTMRENLESINMLEGNKLSLVEKSILKKYEDMGTQGTDAFLMDLTMKSLIGNLEFTMLFSGDPAFYKDLSKRTQATISTGIDATLLPDVPRYYNASVMSKYKLTSEFFESYRDTIKGGYLKAGLSEAQATVKAEKAVEPYDGLEEGDAQGYITPTRYKNLMRMLGMWTTDHNDAFEKLIAGEKVDMDALQVMQPLKGMHYELRDGGSRKIPTYIKYSQAVLWPSLVKGSKLEGLLAEMERSKTDEAIFESGVKVGAEVSGISKALVETNNIELTPMKMDNMYWKLQQDLPSKLFKKKKALEGSQPKKNILANLNLEEAAYNGKTGREIANELNSLHSDLSNRGRKSLEKRWEMTPDGKIGNYNAVYEDLIRKFKQDQVSDNVIAALEAREPLSSIFQFEHKIEQQLLSIITTETVKTTMPGGALIQVSSFGFQKQSSELSKELAELVEEDKKKGPTGRTAYSDPTGIKYFYDVEYLKGPNVKDGKLKKGQVFLPHFVMDDLKKHEAAISAKFEGRSVDELTGVDLRNIFNGALDGVIGYRIPNQGLSSIDTLEVVGILPKHMGDSIVTYREVTAKTGSDFDIDKMYVMFHNLDFDPATNTLKRTEYLDETTKVGERHFRYYKPTVSKAYKKQMKAGMEVRDAYAEMVKDGKLPTIEEFESTVSIQEQNSKRAVQNRILDTYNTILTSPETHVDAVTPLDSSWLSEDAYYLAILGDKVKGGPKKAAAFLEAENKKAWLGKNFTNYGDLEEFSLATQMRIKVQNMAGKAGVGQTANHLTHHPLAQLAEAYLNTTLSISKQDGNVTSLALVYNEDKEKITNVISAWLNAYVDNAKDPYISLINNNTKTANTVFMLLRAGVSPAKVNRLMTQPIVKAYVERLYNNDQKLVKTYSDKKEMYPRIAYNEATMDTYISKNKFRPGVIEDFLIDNVAKNFDEKFTSVSTPSWNTEDMEADIADGSVNSDSQIGYLKEFLKYQKVGTKLGEAVSSMKADTNGAGSSLVESQRIVNKRSDILAEGFVGNYDRMVAEGTAQNTYYKNSVKFALSALSNGLISGTPMTYSTINSTIKKLEIADTEENRKHVLKELKSYIYSGHPLLNLSKEEKMRLTTVVPNKLNIFKKNNKGNGITDILAVRTEAYEQNIGEGETETKYRNYISSVSSSMDKVEANIVWTEWEAMLKDETPFGAKGDTIASFAKQLIQYTFLNSGFNKNNNSFFDHIPSTFLKEQGMGTHIKWQIQNMQSPAVMEEFIMQYSRNNLDKVPRYNASEVAYVEGPITVDEEALPIVKRGKSLFKKIGNELHSVGLLGTGSLETKRTYKEYNMLEVNPLSGVGNQNFSLVTNINEVVPQVEVANNDVVLEESDFGISIQGIEDAVMKIEAKETKDGEGNLIQGFTTNIYVGETVFEVDAYAYEDYNEARENGKNILTNLGFDLLNHTLKNACK